MRIVVLHAGGLGDLVLLESYFAALRHAHPGAQLELVCRADVAPIATLYAQPPDTVHAFGFNPYRWALPDGEAALQAKTLLAKLAARPVDLFVSAELQATWLSEILAAALDPHDAVIADDRKASPSDLLILLAKLRLQRNGAVRRLSAAGAEHELDRYARLAGAAARRLPQLRLPGERGSAAELVVFALADSRIKRWPLPAMGAAAVRIAAARDAAVVLVGGENDRAELEAAVTAGTFGDNPGLVIGTPQDLPAVAARIAAAVGYLGIDTGLVHLAAAYRVPGAAVFGGGHWPVYGPWAPRSAGVVAPIPCFGCQWDCAFDHAFCLEGVDVDSVVSAFEQALCEEESPVVRELDAYGPGERAIFAAAAGTYRAAQFDRSARLTAITRLRNLLARYTMRARARNRKADAVLAGLAETTSRAARRLEEARMGTNGSRAAARRSAEQ